MVPGFTYGTTPVAGLPFTLTVLPNPPQPSLADEFESAIHLLEIPGYTGVATTAYFPPTLFGNAPVAGLPFDTALSGQTTTLQMSDRGWIGDPDEATTAARNQAYEPRLMEVPDYAQEVPVTPEAGSRGARSTGDIRLDDLDGALTTWPAQYAIAGRTVRVLRARWDPDSPPAYADFDLLFAASMAGWSTESESELVIALGGSRLRLDAPAQPRAYLGTGGAEGGSSWTGVSMPDNYGRVRNVAGDLIDTTNLVYRVHSRAVRAISAVRDLGADLTATSDYQTYADLVAASLSSGQYATCLAEGLFRLHSKLADAVITCDVDGDVDEAGSWAETHAEIARRILLRGGVASGDIATLAFASGWPAGTAKLSLPSTATGGRGPTVADTLDRLSGSVAGWWREDRAGRISIGRVKPPSSVESVLSIPETSFRDRIQEVRLPRPPRAVQRVTWRRIETVQDRFAGGLAEATQALYRQQWREASDSDSDIATRYPYASDPPLHETLFDAEADAEALAQHLMDCHGPDRRIHRLPVGPVTAFVSLGDIVTVSYPRGGFGSAKAVQVVGINDRAGELTVWG